MNLRLLKDSVSAMVGEVLAKKGESKYKVWKAGRLHA